MQEAQEVNRSDTNQQLKEENTPSKHTGTDNQSDHNRDSRCNIF